MKQFALLIAKSWKDAFQDKAFKERLIWGVLGLIIVSLCTHYFFDYNEDRKGGMVLYDWILKVVPAENVSIPISILMLSVVGLFFWRSLTNPNMFIMALIAYAFLLIFRMLTIAITHFQPPPELVDLHDPVSSLIYGSRYITKDLFFSGHIATASLVYLCMHKKSDRHYLLFVIFAVSALLLVQHIHYTIDIICAPFFALGSLWLARKVIHLQYGHIPSK